MDFLERGAKSLDGLDLRFRAGEIAGARHSETAGETSQRIRLWVLARREWERRGAGPIGAFEHITRRHGVLGREVDEGDGTIATVGGGERFVGQRLGLGVLRKLQVRVDREIRRVIVVGLDLDRRSVRRDRFLPQPDHGVDVRWHVPGVRHGWRDARIAPGGGNALFRERVVVVGMNEEMRHARMLRVLVVQLFQNCRRLDLVGIGRVGRRRRRLQGKRIEHLRLVVVGVALRQLLHRIVVGDEPGIDRSLVVVAVIGAQRLDPVALALGLRADLTRLFERGPGRPPHPPAAAPRRASC